MKKLNLCILLALVAIVCNGQFQYMRPLEEVRQPGWYRLSIPDDLYAQAEEDLRDLRILGITEKGDTVEAPYIIESTNPVIRTVSKNHAIINQSRRNRNYYYTLEMQDESAVNEIELELLQQNFSWRVTLEGSQDQVNWYGILDRYRIIGISNNQTDYKYTRLRFPDSKYKYYRIAIKSNSRPTLNAAYSTWRVKDKGQLETRTVSNFSKAEDKMGNTVIDITLDQKTPVSRLQLQVADTFDYYRPVKISRLTDCIESQNGKSARYQVIYGGILSSLNKDPMIIDPVLVGQLKVEIVNHDNEPLNIIAAKVKGPGNYINFRVTKEARYGLFYGNPSLYFPQYDITRFTDKVPEQPNVVIAGNELKLKNDNILQSALIENELWLWVVMGLIILLLGGFSIKMLKSA